MKRDLKLVTLNVYGHFMPESCGAMDRLANTLKTRVSWMPAKRATKGTKQPRMTPTTLRAIVNA